MSKTRYGLSLTVRALVVSAGVGVVVGSVSAASYSVNWLSYAPTAFNTSFPSGSSFNLPGVGLVGVTYTLNPGMSEARVATPDFDNGTINFGPDSYSWGAMEVFGRTVVQPVPPLIDSWTVTYSFPATINAGQLVLGVSGLGRRDDPLGGTPGAVTTLSVLQNGTFLGDWFGTGGPWGATQYTGGPGVFTMENSVTGVGGANPHWNTALGLVRIDDAVNSLTIRVDQTSGDGIGVNIGVLVPGPGGAALLGVVCAGACVRRRRGS